MWTNIFGLSELLMPSSSSKNTISVFKRDKIISFLLYTLNFPCKWRYFRNGGHFHEFLRLSVMITNDEFLVGFLLTSLVFLKIEMTFQNKNIGWEAREIWICIFNFKKFYFPMLYSSEYRGLCIFKSIEGLEGLQRLLMLAKIYQKVP